MTKILLSTILIFSYFGASSQYCTSGGPSSTADSNLESLIFTGTSGGINYVGCPGVLGVQEYFTQTTTVDAGANYVMTIQFGTCGGNYNSVAEVWIDFNGNNLFEASESVLTWSGLPPMVPGNYVVSIPATSMTGQTRMRVMQAEGQALPLDPCTGFTWGSVTDFNITIENGVDCTGYVGDTRTDARLVPSIPFTESYDNSFCYSNQNPAYASPDVFYKFATGSHAALEVSLCGSTFDTFLSIQDQWGNVIAANDDDPSCGTQSQVSFSTAGFDTLYAVVEGWGSEMGAYTINIGEGTLNTSNLLSEQFNIKPNPASEQFSISGSFEGQITVMNSEGRQVLDQNYFNNEMIDISSLPTGFYIVRLISNERIYDRKLIIE